MERNSIFISRSICEVCNTDNPTQLLSINYESQKIQQFINNYYDIRHKKILELFNNEKYEIVKCKNCGFIWQKFVLNDEYMNILYDNWISAQDSLRKKKEANAEFFKKLSLNVGKITRLLNKIPYEINVLDFGMGWGYWCVMAKAFGYIPRGFELSKSRIEYAKNNGIEVIDNYNDISKFKFDYINVDQVFEHITDPLGVLKYLVSCMKENAIIKISVQNGKNIERIVKDRNWKPTKGPIQPLEHINCFTYDTLVKLGELANLKLINLLENNRLLSRTTLYFAKQEGDI